MPDLAWTGPHACSSKGVTLGDAAIVGVRCCDHRCAASYRSDGKLGPCSAQDCAVGNVVKLAG